MALRQEPAQRLTCKQEKTEVPRSNQKKFVTLVYLNKGTRRDRRKKSLIAFVLRENCVTHRDPEGILLNSDPVSIRGEFVQSNSHNSPTHLVHVKTDTFLHLLPSRWRLSRYEIIFLTVSNANRGRKVC